MEEEIQKAQDVQDSTAISSITSSIESKIFTIRGKQVMIDRDLAVLYGVETKQMNRQVLRNIERFPSPQGLLKKRNPEIQDSLLHII